MDGPQHSVCKGLEKRIQMARPPAIHSLDFRDVPIVVVVHTALRDETIKIWPSLIETENSS